MDEGEQGNKNDGDGANGGPKPKKEAEDESSIGSASASASSSVRGGVEGETRDRRVDEMNKVEEVDVVTVTSVLTKVQDGGSNEGGANGQQAIYDAFRHYSNNNVRMTHLLLLGLDENDEGKNE